MFNVYTLADSIKNWQISLDTQSFFPCKKIEEDLKRKSNSNPKSKLNFESDSQFTTHSRCECNFVLNVALQVNEIEVSQRQMFMSSDTEQCV